MTAYRVTPAAPPGTDKPRRSKAARAARERDPDVAYCVVLLTIGWTIAGMGFAGMAAFIAPGPMPLILAVIAVVIGGAMGVIGAVLMP